MVKPTQRFLCKRELLLDSAKIGSLIGSVLSGIFGYLFCAGHVQPIWLATISIIGTPASAA